ncbi:DUF2975 domain-containing protein [Lachnospiraceae bacterium NSJ-143]|nr:DUF2975 domain-containing protein [Lachnospiraceae bacterium NSJ-143]
MWNAKKSVVLSCVCTKAVIFLGVLFLLSAPYWVNFYVDYAGKVESIKNPLLFTIYSAGLFGMYSLICLSRLLSNIKSNEVFVENNVRQLRAISWCCFAVAFILLVSGFYYILFVIGAVAAGFFGLILRVVKNVIEQAVILKNENDFTI